jgi:hypothetical protein
VLRALRAKRNRPCLQLLVLVQLLSLVSLLVSSSCAMPPAHPAQSNCSQTHHGHEEHGRAPVQKCSDLPCFAAQPNPAADFAIDFPRVAACVHSLLWVVLGMLFLVQAPNAPRANSPPDGRHIPLFHRYCTLLI